MHTWIMCRCTELFLTILILNVHNLLSYYRYYGSDARTIRLPLNRSLIHVYKDRTQHIAMNIIFLYILQNNKDLNNKWNITPIGCKN